jgi:hypothetical protein
MFSQGTYEMVATVLRQQYDVVTSAHEALIEAGNTEGEFAPVILSLSSSEVTIEGIVAAFANLFADDSPRFKRDLFYRAALGRDRLDPGSIGKRSNQ